jgi:predicted PP-loop superfamily ATPase
MIYLLHSMKKLIKLSLHLRKTNYLCVFLWERHKRTQKLEFSIKNVMGETGLRIFAINTFGLIWKIHRNLPHI